MKTVAVSGGFDPLHSGHVQLLEQARKLGDELVVILNNDNWLQDKKGFVFIEARERKELLLALRCVDRVIITDHKPGQKDSSVCRELRALQPSIFANGGDRNMGNIPEYELCEMLGIQMQFNIGGDKTQSSSWLLNKIRMLGITEKKPWGSFTLYQKTPKYWVKTLTLDAGCRTSLQSHGRRREIWVCVEGTIAAEHNGAVHEIFPGDTLTIDRGDEHRLGSDTGGTIVEVAYGEPDEDDINRLEDDYGRA